MAAKDMSESTPEKVNPSAPKKIFRPKTNWSEERRETLREYIKNFRPLEDAGVSHVNIILVGQQGTGKSSLFNTIDSALHGTITQTAEARAESKSVTLEIDQHRLRGQNNKPLNITISDTIGIGRGGQIDPQMADTMRQGVLPCLEINRHNRMHCGVFVLPVTSKDFPAEDVLDTLLKFQEAFVLNNIKYIVALTKIDDLADEDTDIREIYHSVDMAHRVQQIADFFRINKNRVWPMKNYTDEVEDTELYIDILALSILKQMIHDANSTLAMDIDKEALLKERADVKKQKEEKEQRERAAIDLAIRQREQIEELQKQAWRDKVRLEEAKSGGGCTVS